MRWVAWVIALGAAGCIKSDSTVCGERVCPAGTECAELLSTMGDPYRCVDPDAVAVCGDVPFLDACGYPGLPEGVCYATMQGSVCLPGGCGNFLVDKAEVCDDGNAYVGDGCSAACTSDETCGNGVIDPLGVSPEQEFVLDEVCDDRNLGGFDGCTSGCETESPRWARVDVTQPPARDFAELAYDPIRRRVVMFGGNRASGTDCREKGVPVNDTWESAGDTSWVEVTPTLRPSARLGHMMDWDGNSKRVILFGGAAGSTFFDDTWSWDGTTWTELTPSTTPPARETAAMAYDSRRKKLVLFGGRSPTSNVVFNDTWEWDGTNWTPITTPVSPLPRQEHAMAYDPRRGVIVMAGGNTLPYGPPDTWEYDGTTWTLVATTGTPHAKTMEYDPVGQTMITYAPPFGGSTLSTYVLNGGAWQDVGGTAPGALNGAAIATDPRGHVVMFGGTTRMGSFPSCVATHSAETWLWSGSQWTTTPALSPSPRGLAAAAVDVDRRRIVVVGGESQDSFNFLFNETWELDGTTWTLFDQQPWSVGRYDAAVAYDAGRKELVLFGGDDGPTVVDETFVRVGTTWAQKFPAMSPTPRAGHSMVYDAARGRVLLFGGISTGFFDETWEWDGVTWTRRTPAHAPPARIYATMVYDPLARNVVLFGGRDAGTNYRDTWIWDGNDWIKQTPTARPEARFAAGMAWDAARRRLVLTGGRAGSLDLDDAWEWYGGNWHAVITTARPPRRSGHLTVPALDGAGIYTIGGLNSPDAPYEMWRLRWESTGVYEYCAQHSDNDNDGHSGCADSDCWATCTPLCPPGTTCDAAAPRCGDQVCNAVYEDCRACPEDCVTCTGGGCGDTFCDQDETPALCPGDCI